MAFAFDPSGWVLAGSRAASNVAAVVGVGIMTLGYVNRLGGVTQQMLGIDSARAVEQGIKAKLMKDGAPKEKLDAIDARIQQLGDELAIIIERAYLLRRMLLCLHGAFGCLFLSAFWALLVVYHKRMVYGDVVLVCLGMLCMIASLFYGFRELHISTNAEKMETRHVFAIPTKPK